VELVDPRVLGIKDGGLGGFNPYGNAQRPAGDTVHLDITIEEVGRSVAILPWVLLPCGCLFLRDKMGGVFLSRGPSCWALRHLFFSFIDGLFFSKERRRCLDGISRPILRLVGREDVCALPAVIESSNQDIPQATRGAKDDCLGGFNPYGNEQMSQLAAQSVPCWVRACDLVAENHEAAIEYRTIESFSGVFIQWRHKELQCEKYDLWYRTHSKMTRSLLDRLLRLLDTEDWTLMLYAEVTMMIQGDHVPEPLSWGLLKSREKSRFSSMFVHR
jgi:hypothetical protein